MQQDFIFLWKDNEFFIITGAVTKVWTPSLQINRNSPPHSITWGMFLTWAYRNTYTPLYIERHPNMSRGWYVTRAFVLYNIHLANLTAFTWKDTLLQDILDISATFMSWWMSNYTTKISKFPLKLMVSTIFSQNWHGQTFISLHNVVDVKNLISQIKYLSK